MIDSRYVLCGLALALPMCGGGAMPEPAAAPSKAAPANAAPPPAYPGYPAGTVAPAPAEASPVDATRPGAAIVRVQVAAAPVRRGAANN